MLDALAASAVQLADPKAEHKQKPSNLVEEMTTLNVGDEPSGEMQ